MSINQGTFDLPNGDGKMGESDQIALKLVYPNTPYYSTTLLGIIDRDTQAVAFKGHLNATATEHGNVDFSLTSLNYDENDVPGLADLDGNIILANVSSVAGDGLPATPFVPNVASPIAPEGTVYTNYSQQPAATPGSVATLLKTSLPPGVGIGSALNPSDSAAIIAAQDFDTINLEDGSGQI